MCPGVYQHGQSPLPPPPTTSQVIDRSPRSRGKAAAKTQQEKATSKQLPAEPTAPPTEESTSQQQKAKEAADASLAEAAAAAAAEAGSTGAEASLAGPAEEAATAVASAAEADEKNGPEKHHRGGASKEGRSKGKHKKGLSAATAATAAAPAPMLGVPGAPQPSPLDQEYQGTAAPWSSSDLGHLSLASLELQPDLNGHLPALPSIQVLCHQWFAVNPGAVAENRGFMRSVDVGFYGYGSEATTMLVGRSGGFVTCLHVSVTIKSNGRKGELAQSAWDVTFSMQQVPFSCCAIICSCSVHVATDACT